MSPYYGKPLRTITSFDECDDQAKIELRRFFTLWAKHHVESPKAITEEKLKEIVDRLVFDSDFWDSSLPPATPKFEKPKFNTNTVRIGVFNKDLPDPKKAKFMFDDEPWDEMLLTLLGQAPRYKVPRARKAGQPAVLRTRLDKIGLTIVFEYFDTEGRYAPANYIHFRTGPDNKPDNDMVAKAIVLADGTLSKAYDQWNHDLCVYLCRRMLFDACHATPWNPEEGNEKHNWDERFFLRAPSIVKELPKIQERLAKIQRMTSDKKPIHGPFGSFCFNVPSEPEPESEIKSDSKFEGDSEPEVQYQKPTRKRKFDSSTLE